MKPYSDNDIIDLMATRIESAMTQSGWKYPVIQLNQPTQQGAPSEPAVFFQKIGDKFYGSPARRLDYDANLDIYNDNEIQICESTFQITSLVIQHPGNTDIPTASDVINYTKMYLQHAASIRYFKNLEIGMLRILNATNYYFTDDKSRFEANPAIELTLRYSRVMTMTVGAVHMVIDSGEYPV